MSTPAEPTPTPRQLGESLAAQIGNQDWVLDAEDLPISDSSNSEFGIRNSESKTEEVENSDDGSQQNEFNPKSEIRNPKLDDPQSEIPLAEAADEPDIPPAPLQIIEAMLFIGGQPLKAEKACAIVRGLSVEQFREAIETLNRVYRLHNRPYFVAACDQGYALTVRPRYRSIKERIFGGPREARLTQAALDVLALVAYRQPAAKNEIDTIRGVESGHLLRQLVRLGLISVVQRAEAKQREVSYGTTQRFIELFNLKNLDDLPQMGDPQRL